jgi:LemA protein
VVWVIGTAVVIVAVMVALAYNRLVALRAAVRASWANVDVELNRRHDLIHNLVRVTDAAASHERRALEAIAQARAEGHRPGRSGAERDVTGIGRELVMLAEAYPHLRAQASFCSLAEELALTEDRLAAARRLHNNSVMSLNKRVESFPLLLLAGAVRIGRQSYLEFDRVIDAVPSTTSLN